MKNIALILAVMFTLGATTPAYASDSVDNQAGASDSVTVADIQSPIDMQDESLDAVRDLDVSVSHITDSSAHLAWSAATMYLRYNVLKYNPVTQMYEQYTVTNKPSVTLNNLDPSVSYTFKVEADQDKAVFGIAKFTTTVKKPKLSVKEVSSDEVKLTITNTSKNSTIEIYRGKDKHSLKKIGQIKGSKKSYTDTEVKSKKEYYYKAKTVTQSKNKSTATQSKVVSAKTPVKMGLPSVSGKTKTYAYYTAVTVRSSPQYKLLHSSKCYTDSETGIRMIDDCYCIALGSYYGSKIGTKYKITLSSGKSFNAILCDQKANRHTDSNNQYAMRNRDIVEFYVEKGKIPQGVRGDYGHLKQFEGDIVSIEKFA